MVDERPSQEERHKHIQAEIGRNPFISDEDLALRLQASIHTIRSDRRLMGIPEVRKRGQQAAQGLFGQPRALSQQEVVGEILEVCPDKDGLSLLETSAAMGLKSTGFVRGHILFAQASTLAAAVVDAELALTASAQVEYLAPARVGERILAKARVTSSQRRRRVVEVVLKAQEQAVFHGLFMIDGLSRGAALHLRPSAARAKGQA